MREAEPVITSGRFEIRKRLGEGGFGTVYAAFDRELKIPVAIKRLRHPSGDALYRFKREFRALAGVVHPNLVSLYELFQAEDGWYFTMELVQGQHLFSYLRPTAAVPTEDTVENGPLSARKTLIAPPPVTPTLPDLGRLRAAFRQLAEGMLALHDAGLLHRDVKSTNVLVTDDGRVVVLDFGLVTHLRSADEGDAAGTPLYMAPEQWLGGNVTEASDWYSVGVVLYEALTGMAPFSGSVTEIAQQKLEGTFPRPHVVNPLIPEDLAALCEDLLRLAPNERPRGEEVLARLGGDVEAARRSGPRVRSFVGRDGELTALRAAARRAMRGEAMVVHVAGESGIGKSALCEQLCAELESDALVLRGRSYAQESLPYKALDGAIDDLAYALSRLPPQELQALLPAGMADLAALFPVLRRLGPLERTAGDSRHSAVEVRRRAFAALRELLARVGRQRPVVLFLDDVHWGDVDSVGLLHTLLLPPEPPAVLLLLTYRPDEAAASPFLRAFEALPASAAPAAGVARIDVGRLDRDACKGLVAKLLGAVRPPEEYVARVLSESGGNPLFVEELVRFIPPDATPPTALDPLTSEERRALLVDMVQKRIDELPESGRRLVDVVALTDVPIDVEAARKAAGLTSLDGTLLNKLRASHLVRTRQLDGRDQIAPYHDRIRDAVAQRLEPGARRGLHVAIAEAVIETGGGSPAVIATHLHQAGQDARAAEFAHVAADRAAQALAFDEAAELYRKVLAWGAGPLERTIRRKLADMLASSGRALEAAPLYLEAASGAAPLERIDLSRLAFEQYTAGGRVHEAMAILRRVCDWLELPCPSSRAHTLALLIGDLVKLRVRGIEFRERLPEQIPPRELLRIDTCLSASRSLVLYDPVLTGAFNGRALALALRAGEPMRTVEGLAAVGTWLVISGGVLKDLGERMLARAREIAERRVSDPKAKGLLLLWSAYIDYAACRWGTALATWDEALALLRRCQGVGSEIQKAQLNGILAVQMMGHMGELERRTERALADARATGNRYTDVYARLYASMVRLAADDPAGARERIAGTFTGAPPSDHSTRVTALKFECYCDVYEGRPGDAAARLERAWPRLRASGMMQIPRFRVAMLGLRAGVTLERLARGDGGRRALRLAEADVRDVERVKDPYTLGRAALLRAAIALHKGDRTLAVARLEAACRAFDGPALAMEQAYARRRLGLVLGGEQGLREVAGADTLMRSHGVKDPARWTAAQAPGFLHRGGP